MAPGTKKTPSPGALVGLPKEGDVLCEKYRIERLLGAGGVGAVFLAFHEILQHHVAIKVLLPDLAKRPEVAARFLNEARSVAALRNEHVAQVMDVGTAENGAAFMVLEYLDGEDLAQVINDRGGLPVEEAVDYVLQALEAVAHAHAVGIVHRDLKPANLFLAKRQDGTYIVKVLDFGISKNTEILDAGVTTTRTTLGSPGYMAPEQVRSTKSVDARADIWSIGVILYKLLTRRSPFGDGDVGAVFAAILQDQPPPVRSLRDDVPVELDRVIARCLEKKRDDRYPNVAELARALAPCAPPESSVSIERICRVMANPPTRRAPTQGALLRARDNTPAAHAATLLEDPSARLPEISPVAETMLSAGAPLVPLAPSAPQGSSDFGTTERDERNEPGEGPTMMRKKRSLVLGLASALVAITLIALAILAIKRVSKRDAEAAPTPSGPVAPSASVASASSSATTIALPPLESASLPVAPSARPSALSQPPAAPPTTRPSALPALSAPPSAPQSPTAKPPRLDDSVLDNRR